ncbi:MAG TPA: EamA family transporter [Chloroflexota bacterium]|jgi:DME family drug/metabolite transporter|nr:EamA family transporter [Chloroflexota bacterium]
MDTRLLVVGLSLLAAVCLAGVGIATKLGLRYSDVRRSIVITFTVNALALVVALLVVRPPLALPPALLGLFALDGVLGLVAVTLLFVGVDRVGPAISYPIKNASPVAGLAIAALALGERPALPVYIGALLAVVGVMVLSLQPGKTDWRPRAAILFPIAGALFFALDNIVRRAALREGAPPLVGLSVAICVSSALALGASLLVPAWRAQGILDPGTPYFALSGLLQTLALLAVYAALGMGMVSVVLPLYTSSPLFVLPLAAVFLRGSERITPRIVLGALAVVLGVALVSLYS